MSAIGAPARPEPLSLRVTRIGWEAEGVISIELRRKDGGELPPFTPGAHIDLVLPNGLERHYSMTADPKDRNRYVIGVGLDAASRGGSLYLHTQLHVGQMLTIGGPRNNFPLVEDAAKVVLIAGGIGITPLYCMTRRLVELGRPFELFYATRSAERAAFLGAIRELGAPVTTHFDSEHGGKPIAIAPIIEAQPPETHFYCCGPLPMLDAFEKATAALPPERVHVEYFTPRKQQDQGAGKSLTVVLGRSGKEVTVAPDQTVLQALRAAGLTIESSCEEGICGTCEVRVLEGVPDHRCSVLSKAERDAGKSMMVCVSRCKGDRLVLDLG